MSQGTTKIIGHFPTASPEEREWYMAQIEPVTNRWMQNEVSQAHMVVTLISGANAGGAVAILAYISQLAAAGKAAKTIANPELILLGYVLGFVAALLLAICIYYASLRRLNIWTSGVGAFYKGDRLWPGLWAKQSPAWYGGKFLHVLGWVSLGCFLAASAIGITQMVRASGGAPPTQTTPELVAPQSAAKAPDASRQTAPIKAPTPTPERAPKQRDSKQTAAPERSSAR